MTQKSKPPSCWWSQRVAPSASGRWTSASISSVSKSRCMRSLATFSSSVRWSSTPDLGVRKPQQSVDAAALLRQRLLGGIQGGRPERDPTVQVVDVDDELEDAAAVMGLRVKRVDLLHRRITVAEQLLEVRAGWPSGRQDRRRPAHGDPPFGRGRAVGRAPEPVRRGRPGRAGVPGRAGRPDPPQQLHPAGSGSQPPEPPGSRGCASMTCGTRRPPWRLRRAPALGS
jgi:hypothetical protein